MAIIKKFSSYQNLTNFQTFIVDTNPNSEYFRITEFKETFTGGKNGFLIEGSPFLKESTEVKIEVLDVDNNPVYYEPGDGIPEYYEGISKLVAVNVYDDTPIGLGKITILGELKEYIDENGAVLPIPDEWKGVYNVKWERSFQINKNLNNESIVRFYKRPQITITELVKPIFSKTIPQVTDIVEVSGEPQQPPLNTNLSTWTASTLYKLIRETGSWDKNVDENEITFSSLNYSANIIEVLNDREVLVDIPYTEDNLVKSFISETSSVTYTDFQNGIINESALTGSFAKIDMSQLKTFVGDVVRVKIFRKSRQSAGDFNFVQESKLESTELLRDVTTQEDTELSYGQFDENTLSKYWITSSNDHPTTIDSSALSQAVKVDYNGSGVQKLITSESFSISQDVEYTLSFKTLLSGSTSDDKYINAYLSGSYTNNLGNGASYTQSFMKINGSDIFSARQNVSQNILAERDIDAKLVFEFKGDDWYISNVSLRNAQETSFSPDEFTLIQDIPRKLASETFDFRFEFYDINNNYIPVDVLASHTFNGGNDFPTSGKLLTFESDRNAFRFSSGSVQNPTGQQIQFKITQFNLTGSVLFESSAFDVDGNYLEPSEYSQYPGLLTSVNPAGALVTINNFTGSRIDGMEEPYVGSVIYTASLESLQEFETVYRLEDGDNAPQLIVTSNANQFIYEPTSLSPKPSGQSITVRAQRKNLASLVTPIEVNKSNSNDPDLNYVDTVNGIDTYTISALQFSASFSQNNFDEVTYSFTGSDVFGNQQSDEITLSKVINFDGVSVVLSTENTSFESDSTGNVTSTEFDNGDGEVDVRIGSNVIQHSEGLGGRNTFDIISITPSSGVTANSTLPTTNSYGISAMGVDSGTLTLLIRYKAGDNTTTVDFTKKVNYSKTKIAAPIISIETANKDQSVSAKSTGEQIDSFLNSIVNVKEQYNGSSSTKTITSLTATSPDISSISTTPSSGLITLAGRNLGNDKNNTTVAITAQVTDTEGTNRTITDTISLSKSKNAKPTVVISATPQSQNVSADSNGNQTGTLLNVTISALEGDVSRFTSMVISSTSGFSTLPTVSGNTLVMNSAIMNTSEGSVVLTVTHTDSEGTSGQTKSITIVTSKVNEGQSGEDGTPGSNGVVINISPSSQTVKRSTSGTFDTPLIFTITVVEDGSPLTHQSGTSTPTTSKFTITSLTNGTLSAGSGTTTPDIIPTTPNTTAGLTTTFDITYTDSQGNTSSAIAQSHVVNVSLDGTTGPGVVHTGVWEVGRAYQYSDGLTSGTGRRDTVLWSSNGSAPYDTYYAVNSSHTSTNNSSSSTGRPDLGGPWTSLGTQDFFVAAKIGIFEDSFVQNTLNIGTNDNGGVSSANITLAGGTDNPYLSIGQGGTIGSQGYNINGIFLGQDGGVSKLSLKSATNSLLWDGTDLIINGSGTFSGQITASSGQIGGWTIGATTLTGGSTTLNSNGTLTINNLIANNAGTIAGWSIDSNSLVGGSTTTTIGLIPDSGIHLGNSVFGSSPFRVTNTGVLTATDATISGSINATDGQIGGWIIDGGVLASANGEMELDANTSTISAATGSMVIKPGDLTPTTGSSVGVGISGSIQGYPGFTYSTTQNTGTTRFTNISTNTFEVTSTGQYIGTINSGHYDVAGFLLTTGSIVGNLETTLRADIKFEGNLIRTIDLATAKIPVPDGDTGLITNSETLLFEFNQTGTYDVELYLFSNNQLAGPSTVLSQGLAPSDTIISVDKIVQFTEITNKGIQVVQSDSKFVKMQTDDTVPEVVEINGVMKLTPQDSLPASGYVGQLVVFGSNLYFHNGTIWSQIN